MMFKKISAIALSALFAVSFSACSQNTNQVSEGPSSAAQAEASKTTGSAETTETDNALLEKAKEANATVENYKSNIVLNFEFENGSGTSSAEVDTDIVDFQSSPVEKHISIDTKGNGEEMDKSEFYVREQSGVKTLYLKSEDEWYKSEIDDESLFLMLGQYDIKTVTDIFIDAVSDLKEDGEEDVNGVAAYKATGVIGEGEISAALIDSGIFVVTGMTSLTEETMSGTSAMPITFWFNKETGNVIKIEFDAAGAYQQISDNVFAKVEGQAGYENAQKLVVNKYSLVYTIEDIGSAEKIEFPAEIDSAKEMEDTNDTEEESVESSAVSSAE